MDPIDKDLEKGFESWFTRDNTYWAPRLYGSRIIDASERFIMEKICGFKNIIEFSYAEFYNNTDLLRNIFFSEDIPKEVKKLFLFVLTPMWKVLGTLWPSLQNQEDSQRVENIVKIVMEDEPKLIELITKGNWESISKMYRNPPKSQDAEANKNRDLALMIIAVAIIISLIILSSAH